MLSPEGQRTAREASNPYYRPDTLALITEAIATTPLETLRTKRFTMEKPDKLLRYHLSIITIYGIYRPAYYKPRGHCDRCPATAQPAVGPGYDPFVTDGDGRLAGTLTDGDIRRGLLAGATLNDKVTAVAHRNFRALRSYAPDLDLLRQWRTAGIRLIPELDADGRITDIIDTSTTTTRLPVSAILMAGGKGSACAR